MICLQHHQHAGQTSLLCLCLLNRLLLLFRCWLDLETLWKSLSVQQLAVLNAREGLEDHQLLLAVGLRAREWLQEALLASSLTLVSWPRQGEAAQN